MSDATFSGNNKVSITFYSLTDSREWTIDNFCVYSTDAHYSDCFSEAGSPEDNQTATPSADLTNTSNGIYNITLNASDSCTDKCLIYQDSVNVVNITSFPTTVTGLNNATEYNFSFTVWDEDYTIPESNSSNSILATTAQTTAPVGVGTLVLDWITPTTNANHTSNQWMLYQINITCVGGNCGDVSAWLDPFIRRFVSG